MAEVSIYTDEPEGETEWTLEFNRHTPLPPTLLDPGEGSVEILRLWRGEMEVDDWWADWCCEITERLLEAAIESGDFSE